MTNEELIKMSGELILNITEYEDPYEYDDKEVFEKCRDEFLTLFKDRHVAIWSIEAKECQSKLISFDLISALFDASKNFIKDSKYSDNRAELLFIIMLCTCEVSVSNEF